MTKTAAGFAWASVDEKLLQPGLVSLAKSRPMAAYHGAWPGVATQVCGGLGWGLGLGAHQWWVFRIFYP